MALLPTVLMVDDSPENLWLLGEMLRPEYGVKVANSGQRALELAGAEPRPDLILLDVMMPGMNGFEVLRELRAHPRNRDIPVILVTALDTAEDEERGLELGAVDYITKPVRPAIVLARVRAHLELKQARDRLRDNNALLEAEIVRRLGENQLVQDVSIHALARLAEIRDRETGNHLRRTQEYVNLLANRVKEHPRFAPLLDAKSICLLQKSAPLHDIGKVGIPDHILLKPGPLTADEWEIMKRHAQLGAEAIERAESDAEGSAEFLEIAKTIARHHHERWDGKGYPDGLAGDAIPVAARLMAVADVFDALISPRVYQLPKSFGEARQIIAAERGHQFDPDIVDAFLAGFDSFCAIAQRYADIDAASDTSGGRVRTDGQLS
jgi:putative two-component system response regulator